METTGLAGRGTLRLLDKEPTPAERYAHAAELLAIIKRDEAKKLLESRTA
jgi:hypothetical protein